MKSLRKLSYFIAFVGLAAVAAAVVGSVGSPSITGLLLVTVLAGALAGAPGLVSRRAWPLAAILLPLGAYLLLRAQVPVPPSVHGVGGQLDFLVGQLRAGARLYSSDHFPLDFSAAVSIRMLLSLAVYVPIGVAAFLALSLGKAVPAIAVVLALLGFGFMADESARVVWAPLAFLVLAGCLLVLSRSLRRDRWSARDSLAGAATATVAALLALSLLGTTSVAASKPLRDWRTWSFGGPQSARLGFDWMENYPQLLDPANNAEVMRVKSPVASYWRANTLGSFNGMTWFSGATDPGDRLVASHSSGSYRYGIPPAYPEAPGKLVTESFQVESTYTDHLFVGGSARAVSIPHQVSLGLSSARALEVAPAIGPSFDYSITAMVPQVKPEDLVARGRDYPVDVLVEYTSLPFPALHDQTVPPSAAAWRKAMSDTPAHREWLGLYKVNQDIVGTARDPYKITLLIEEYLRTRYTYSLQPPATTFWSPYAAFLFQTKTGYCQHFAGAMAILLRFNGIPARVAVGFDTGTRQKDGTYVVARNDAHAWVEVFFPNVGWVPFDPTPGRLLPGVGASSASSGFTDPFAGGGSSTTGRSRNPALDLRAPGHERAADQGGAGAGAPAESGWSGWLPASGAVAALLVAWPVGRAAHRRRGLRRGGMDGRFRTSLALLYTDLRDYGIEVPRSQTLDETALLLKSSLGVDAGRVIARAQAVLFGGRSATEADVADLTALRRELKRKMRARAGRVKTVLVLYGLSAPSAVLRS